MKRIVSLIVTLLSTFYLISQTDTIIYHLTISERIVNYSGKKVRALTVNGSIPGPVLTFKQGQYAVIYITNQLKEETSVHWHGLLLPSFQDGVPYLNTPPIKPGETFKFEFPIRQSGTYWYHSHTGLQEQRGVYGAIVILPERPHIKYDTDLVIVFSDWTNENPDNILKTLKRGSEWYQIKKGSVTSLNKVLKEKGGLKAQIKMWMMRMPGMDISDIAYDKFLANGDTVKYYPNLKPGQTVRLRIINASAGTYFWINSGYGDLTIVSADGKDVDPVRTDKLLIAIAETYDIIVKIPEKHSIEIKATAQDGSGHVSVFLGKGTPIYASAIPKPDPVKMMISMSKMMEKKKKGMQMPMMPSESSKNDSIKPFNYNILRSTIPTALPDTMPVKTYTFELTGNMWRYIWSINGKTLSEADKIIIRKGERVRFVLINRTMMHHPMHLHGHFFRVINNQGEYSPLKHTVDVPPMQKVTIEFDANEEDDWFFHCHILYHMKSGMARVIHYQGSKRDPRLAPYPVSKLYNMDKHWFFWGEGALASHMGELNMTLSNTRNQILFTSEYGWNKNTEITLYYERFLGDYFRIYGGLDIENEIPGQIDTLETLYRIGWRWLLPLFVDFDFSIDNLLRPQLAIDYSLLIFPRLEFFVNWELENDFGLTDYSSHAFYWKRKNTITTGVEGIISKNFSILASYDNRFGLGGGVIVRF